MAFSMIGRLAKNATLIRGASSNFQRYLSFSATKKSGYYYLLPEVPEDTPETNAIMRHDTNIPNFKDIDPTKVQYGLLKLALNFDLAINNILRDAEADKNFKATFDTVLAPIEKELVPLEYAIKTARHLSLIYPYSKYTSYYIALQEKISYHKNERWINKKFYKLLKEIESNKHLLTGPQKRLLEKALRMCKQNGTNLNSAEVKVVQEMSNKLNQQQIDFKFRVYVANKGFSLLLNSPNQVKDLPDRVVSMIALDKSNPTKGPWNVELNDEIVDSFLKHSSNRALRKTIYDAYYSRASYVKETIKSNNAEVIKNVIRYRNDQAKFFGYKNYAQYVIENKSASSVENVQEFLDKIAKVIKPFAEEDLNKLQKFASLNGNISALEAHDIKYWKNQHTNSNFKVDEARLMQYFPYKKVMNGLFELSKSLFGIEIREDTKSKDHTWHDDVTVYGVYDENNKHLSTLVVDPFFRAKKYDRIWSYSGRDSSVSTNSKPIAYLNMNIRSLSKEHTVMSFSQVAKLFEEFGKVIQILLTQVDYVELADLHSTEIDALFLNSKLFSQMLYKPQVLKLISANLQNNESLPDDMIQSIIKANQNMSLFRILKNAYMSAFDIEAHISDKFWGDLMIEMWPKFNPYKRPENDYFPCQMVGAFGENFGCLNYSGLWSSMMTLDVLEAFNEVGFDNKEKLLDVGKRYRDTILKNGSAAHANELFRQFRGRNPSTEPFFKHIIRNRNE